MSNQYQQGIDARKSSAGKHTNPFAHERPSLCDYLVQPTIFTDLQRATKDWDDGWDAENEWQVKSISADLKP
jgi:hypothetical protein